MGTTTNVNHDDIMSIADPDHVRVSLFSKNHNINDNTDASLLAYDTLVQGRAFKSNLPPREQWPIAICQARTAQGVQAVVQYCASHNNLQVCIRSGGHSWETTWLQGSHTVLLDVGDFTNISVDADTKTAQVGPGVKGNELLHELAANHELFFPSGHCSGVPLGGFLLGGGYGIGFQRYGLSSMFVQAVDVVLADGRLVTAHADSNDETDRAIFQLVRGSYAGFPGVITKYHLGPLPILPKGVMMGMAFYELDQWQHALTFGSFLSHHDNQEDARFFEPTIILTHAPPPLQEQHKEVQVVVMVAVMVWADTPEHGQALWDKYVATYQFEHCLVPPPDKPNVVPATSVPSSDFYPHKARYQAQVFMGHQALSDLSRPELEGLLSPIVDLWASPERRPPAPSHTLWVCIPPTLADIHPHRSVACGYTPDMGVQTYAIYDDAQWDDQIQQDLQVAYTKIRHHDKFYTSLVEGIIRPRNNTTTNNDTNGNDADGSFKTAFTPSALEETQRLIDLLDPNHVFAGFPTTQK